MDPLSVTTSIIAVIQVTNAVISVGCDYRSAVKNSPWELSRVIEEGVFAMSSKLLNGLPRMQEGQIQLLKLGCQR